ncbi:UNVERIFIED_CONTAM: hypothetical protein GTU68_021651 [Idotea baltica]|nr:hypothetical protein [Idotea baltica]
MKLIQEILLVGLGGSIGAVLRFGLSKIINNNFSYSFPISTFLSNFIGCFLIGLVMPVLERNNLLDSNLKLFLIVGLLGGFTTFSIFGFQVIDLIKRGELFLSLSYVLLSVILCILAVFLGVKLNS